MNITKRSAAATLLLAIVGVFMAACGGNGGGPSGTDPNETADKVNGKAITMQDVDRAVKQQAGGQETKMSPLELAGARLQVLDSLIQQEVMYQKAEKESTVPTDDEVTAEINKQKNASGKTADQIAKEMSDAGVTDATLREQMKKSLAVQKLVDKITGKIEPPKDSEIDAFYNGNKDAFVKKKGVKLGAIVVDPTNSGEGDQTTDEQSAVIKANEIIGKIKAGQDFAALAREYSEDQSKFQSGDLGYLSQDDLNQAFNDQVAAGLMNPGLQIGGITTARSQGKLFILKLQDRSDKDEALTLESPGVRQQVIDSLLNNRKQLLAASYQAIAMNEAKIENFLAKKVVDNPNELSGARPASAASSTPAASNANTAAANANTAANANASKPAANEAGNAAAKPAASPSKPASTPAAKPAASAPANK
ncbi:MAG TPA: SurA N-terminal domain-containing protein [Pyrinomonadaceae bacterium]|nr:SurA N-terminal domain-containing protein [Pyrinomonadaceae bacterium]